MRSASSRPAPNAAVILLVDDNFDGLMARRSVLEELGYKIIPARCGQEAMQLVANQRVDLIITDYKMDPVDGLELINQLRQSNILAPIVLLTGFAHNLGLSPENTGANLVLQKSADELATLLRHIKRLLQPPRKPVRSAPPRKSTARSQKAGS